MPLGTQHARVAVTHCCHCHCRRLLGLRGEHVMGIPIGHMDPVGILWEWELGYGAKLMGIEMGMVIGSTGIRGNGNFVFIFQKEISFKKREKASGYEKS